jgi:transposase-like protein
MSPIPRIAGVPLTSKQPESGPYCGGRNLMTRRGTRRKKLEIVQLWRCAACKRTFTPGPAAIRNKTYPLRMILSALTDYNLGCTLEETAARLKKKTNHCVSSSTIAAWLEQYKQHCSYRRLRAEGLRHYPANQTIRSIKLYHRQIYGYAFHRPKLDFCALAPSMTNELATPASPASPTFLKSSRRHARTTCSAATTIRRLGRRRWRQIGRTHQESS